MSTTRELLQKNADLFHACEWLWNGKSTAIIVANHEIAQMLVAGENPPLKEYVEAMSKEWGVRGLKSDRVVLIVLDFSSGKTPETVVKETEHAIPEFTDPFEVDSHFIERYPGHIFVAIGAEDLTRTVDFTFLPRLAKYMPVAFVLKESTDLTKVNPNLFKAMGEHVAGTHGVSLT